MQSYYATPETVQAIHVIPENTDALVALQLSLGDDPPFTVDLNDGEIVAVLLTRRWLPDNNTAFVKVSNDGTLKVGLGLIVPRGSWLVRRSSFLTFKAPPPTVRDAKIVNGMWDRGPYWEGVDADTFAAMYTNALTV